MLTQSLIIIAKSHHFVANNQDQGVFPLRGLQKSQPDSIGVSSGNKLYNNYQGLHIAHNKSLHKRRLCLSGCRLSTTSGGKRATTKCYIKWTLHAAAVKPTNGGNSTKPLPGLWVLVPAVQDWVLACVLSISFHLFLHSVAATVKIKEKKNEMHVAHLAACLQFITVQFCFLSPGTWMVVCCLPKFFQEKRMETVIGWQLTRRTNSYNVISLTQFSLPLQFLSVCY